MTGGKKNLQKPQECRAHSFPATVSGLKGLSAEEEAPPSLASAVWHHSDFASGSSIPRRGSRVGGGRDVAPERGDTRGTTSTCGFAGSGGCGDLTATKPVLNQRSTEFANPGPGPAWFGALTRLFPLQVINHIATLRVDGLKVRAAGSQHPGHPPSHTGGNQHPNSTDHLSAPISFP